MLENERRRGRRKKRKKERREQIVRDIKKRTFKLRQHLCCAPLALAITHRRLFCNKRKRRMEVVRERKKGGKKEEKKEGKKRTDC